MSIDDQTFFDSEDEPAAAEDGENADGDDGGHVDAVSTAAVGAEDAAVDDSE